MCLLGKRPVNEYGIYFTDFSKNNIHKQPSRDVLRKSYSVNLQYIIRTPFLKAWIRYFLTNFYFWPNDSPSNIMTCFLFHLKNSFLSRNIQIFAFPSSLFLPASHYLRAWSKINFEVHDVINCLNKNLMTHFFDILRRKKCMTLKLCPLIEFMEKWCRKCTPKSSPRPLFILLNNPKQLLHARNYFESKIFWNEIIKNL